MTLNVSQAEAQAIVALRHDLQDGDKVNIIDDGDFLSLIASDAKLRAIKLLKDRTGFGLKESKDFVDAVTIAYQKLLNMEELRRKYAN